MATKQKAKAKGKVREPANEPTSRLSEAQSEVQRCWEDYWARRAELEAAVVLVKEAHRALEDARKGEGDLRRKFDDAKLALKDLLDVDPSPGGDIDSSVASDKFN